MKSSIKKMLAVLAVALVGSAASASDSYLYWMLGETITDTTTGESVAYDYAKVKLDDNYLSLYVGNDAQGTEIDSSLAGTAFYWGKINSDATDSTFLFELFSDSDTSNPVGSFEMSYAAMAGYITDVAGGVTPHGTFTLSSVPEPTSGLLTLLGLAGLALRRKRRA